MSFATAVAFNSEGIRILSSGNYPGALRALEKALVVSQYVSCQATNSSNSDVRSWRLEAVPFVSTISKNTPCLSFDHCFTLVLDLSQRGIPTKDEVEFLIATILYNIALACQHEMFRQNNQLSKYLETTGHIYGMAVNVLLKLDVSTDTLSLLLAISNNMAFLALECLDYDSFDCYQSWIGSVLMSEKRFHPVFFSGNFAATGMVRVRPAAAA